MDTSTPRAAVALHRSDGRLLIAPPADPDQRHARGLVPAIGDLLRLAGLEPKDLGALAVGLGPGSYTGLRIGLTTARTLAYALQCPLIGLDSLEAIARDAPAEVLQIAIIADAQRGDLSLAEFRRSEPGASPIRIGPTRIVASASWLTAFTPDLYVAGPALDRLGPRIPSTVPVAGPDGRQPSGPSLIALAREALDAGRRDDLWTLEPIYPRRSAAEDQWDARSVSEA